MAHYREHRDRGIPLNFSSTPRSYTPPSAPRGMDEREEQVRETAAAATLRIAGRPHSTPPMRAWFPSAAVARTISIERSHGSVQRAPRSRWEARGASARHWRVSQQPIAEHVDPPLCCVRQRYQRRLQVENLMLKQESLHSQAINSLSPSISTPTQDRIRCLSPPATSPPGLGPPRQHPHRDWARPRPHLTRDRAHPWTHQHRDWAHPARICTRGLGPPMSKCAPGLGPLNQRTRICAATPRWDMSRNPRARGLPRHCHFFRVQLARPVRARLRSRVRLCACAWAARGAAEGGVLHEVPSRRGAEGTCRVTFKLTHAQTHQHTRAHAHARTCTHVHA